MLSVINVWISETSTVIWTFYSAFMVKQAVCGTFLTSPISQALDSNHKNAIVDTKKWLERPFLFSSHLERYQMELRHLEGALTRAAAPSHRKETVELVLAFDQDDSWVSSFGCFWDNAKSDYNNLLLSAHTQTR